MKESNITIERPGAEISFWVKHNLHKFGIDISDLANEWDGNTLSPDCADLCLYVKHELQNPNIICQPVK